LTKDFGASTRSFNAKLQRIKVENLELQHKASMHQRREFGASTQSFNALEKKVWNFNTKFQRTREESLEFQPTKAKNLEFQHKASMHQRKELGISTQNFNT
jgi:hypothetical protein